MRSFTQSSFWDAYHRLPDRIKIQARRAYTLFEENPDHPSLNFKRVGRAKRVEIGRRRDEFPRKEP